MSLVLGDNFSYNGSKPLDGRILFATVADMKAYAEASLYNGCFAYITENKKYYTYDSSNTVDSTTGKWREFETGGGGASALDDLSDVDLTNPSSGDYLKYDGTKWVNGAGGGGGGGTSDYPDLTNKPQINGVTLTGNKTSANLSLANAPTVLSQTLSVDSGTGKTPTTVTFSGLPASGNNLIDFFTSNGINYTAITIGNGGASVVLTYPAQDSAYTVYCRIEGV